MLKKIKPTEMKAEENDIEINKTLKSSGQLENEEVVKTSDKSDLVGLIEKNIKWSQVIYEQNKKINNRLTWMVFGSYLRLALIVIPIILAFIYLPPLLNDLFGQYQNILGGASGSPSQFNDLLGKASSGQLQEILKALGGR